MRPSVLHVSQPTDAGVGRIVALLAADQVRRGWNVSVASPEGLLAGEVLAAGATWLPWPARRNPSPATFLEVLRLGRVIRSARPDVVHLHSSKAGLVGRLALRGRTPTVFEPNAWSFHAGGRVMQRFSVAWERLAGRWATVIVCVSDGEREEGVGAGISAAWHVIPNGVDTQEHRPATASDRMTARKTLDISPSARFAVCVGRLSAQKGQDLLLKAWPLVRSEFPTAELALVGDGPMRPQLEQNLPVGVRLSGHREDVDVWLAAADVAVFPSRWEGMSLALLEAMARCRSVVATDVAGARDALGAKSSAVVSVGSHTELAAAVTMRFADPTLAETEGSMNRAIVEERFSLQRIHEAVAELTAALAARSCVPAPPLQSDALSS